MQIPVSKIIKIALAVAPAILAMYSLFLLESNGMWDRTSASRDLMSLAVLGMGLLISFVLLSRALKSPN